MFFLFPGAQKSLIAGYGSTQESVAELLYTMPQKIQWPTQSTRHMRGAQWKGWCNTVEYRAAFLNSDWLYFLWQGIGRVNT